MDAKTEPANEIQERDEILAILEQEFAMAQRREPQEDGLSWLPEWFLGKRARFDDARKALRERYKQLMAHVDAEERALWYRWGDTFREQVREALDQQGGKKKSVKYLTGQSGYRKTKGSIEIADMQAAKQWAAEHLSHAQLVEAISSMNKTPLLEAVEWVEEVDPETGEVFVRPTNVPDGCTLTPPGDTFYPAPPKPKYLPKAAVKELEGVS